MGGLFARGGGGGVGILWEQKFRIARAKKSITSHGLRKNRDPISLLIEHEKTVNRLWNGRFPSIHKCGFLSIYGQYLMGKCTRLSSKILLFLGSFFPTNRVCFRKAPKDSRDSRDSRPEHKGGKVPYRHPNILEIANPSNLANLANLWRIFHNTTSSLPSIRAFGCVVAKGRLYVIKTRISRIW